MPHWHLPGLCLKRNTFDSSVYEVLIKLRIDRLLFHGTHASVEKMYSEKDKSVHWSVL